MGRRFPGKRRRRIWLLGIISFAVLAVWGTLVAIAFSSPGIVRSLPVTAQLPLRDLHDIAIGQDGRIYCALQGYPRIQIYDPDGSFVKGINVPGRPFHMWMGPEREVLNVMSSSNFITYGTDGVVIAERQISKQEYVKYIEAVGKRGEDQVVADEKCNRYVPARWPLLGSRVIKITPDGKRKVVVTQGVAMWALGAPFPAFVFQSVGIAGLVVLYYRHRRARRRVPAAGA